MKKIIISIIIAVVFIGGAVMLLRGNDKPVQTNQPVNVSVIGGKQVIEISAKGGYSPRNTVAQANRPTVIRVKTNGTFDCSSSLTIPSVGYRTNLPTTGETEIALAPQNPGSNVKGVCGMGMYNFNVQFN